MVTPVCWMRIWPWIPSCFANNSTTIPRYSRFPYSSRRIRRTLRSLVVFKRKTRFLSRIITFPFGYILTNIYQFYFPFYLQILLDNLLSILGYYTFAFCHIYILLILIWSKIDNKRCETRMQFLYWTGCPPKQCLQWKLYFAKHHMHCGRCFGGAIYTSTWHFKSM